MSPRASKVLSRLLMATGIFATVTIGLLAWRAYSILEPDPAPQGKSAIELQADAIGWKITPEQVAELQEPMTQERAKQLMGWAGNEVNANEAFQQIKGHFIPFGISDAATGEPATSEDKRAVLWDAAITVTGNHLPVFAQETGDCVSWGMAHALNYLQCVQIATGAPYEFKPTFPPYIYGVSRVFVGKAQIPCRSAGSLGSWAALGVQDDKWGVLFADAPNCPPYSGSLADKWGCKPGPPKQFIDVAKKFTVQSAANVTTWQEVREALVNGYPVTIASNVGFQMSGTVKSGKLWLRQSGSWAHQMCVIGYDVDPEPCFFILNSWGPNAHGRQPDGPSGGFWVPASVIQKIVGQGDSFAISTFEGFPAQQWDLDILKQREARRHEFDPGHAHDRPVRRVESGHLALAL